MGGGGGGGNDLIFRRTEGGSVLTESPKGGSLKILEGFRGDHSNQLGQCQTWGGGGIMKVVNSYEGGSLQ